MLAKLAGHAVGGHIDEDAVQSVLGLVPVSWHATLLSFIVGRDRGGAVRFLHEAQSQGADMDSLTKGFLEYLRQVMIAKIDRTIIEGAGLALADTQARQLEQFAATMDGALLVRAIQTFTHARTQLRTSPIPTLPLELAVISLTEPA
jgi:DNA polymerase III gamma/tau subunit